MREAAEGSPERGRGEGLATALRDLPVILRTAPGDEPPERSLRILYFHQHFSTPGGAAGTRSYEMARHLISRGHQVTMVCGSAAQAETGLDGPFTRGQREGVVDGIRVIELEAPYSNYQGLLTRTGTFLRYALRSTMVALREEADVVFATTTPLTAGIPGIAARWLRGKRFVFEVRDLWPELPKAMGVVTNPFVLGAMRVLERTSYRSAHHCIGLAPGIVAGIQRAGVPADRITMIPNGCDLDLFGPSGEKSFRETDPTIPGVDPGDFVAIFTGAHGIANGLHSVLDAAAVLRDRDIRGIRLLFVGDGKEKPGLVLRAREERLESCIFLDPMPKETLTHLVRAADLGLMILADVPAFQYGTSPNKFFDYIAAGMPVLNNYPGWLADLIEQQGCGVVVSPGNPVAFAEALERLRDDPEFTREAGIRARTLAESRFARQELARCFAAVIEATASPLAAA